MWPFFYCYTLTAEYRPAASVNKVNWAAGSDSYRIAVLRR
jgi:hypothetical protein